MTNDDETAQQRPAQQAPEQQAPAQQAPEQADTPEAAGSREAAKYRRRLRETEAALTAATSAREAAERQLTEHLAARHLARPAALWASGVALDDVRDETGAISSGLVAEAAQRASETLGLARSRLGVVPTQGTGSLDTPVEPWQDTFDRMRPRQTVRANAGL